MSSSARQWLVVGLVLAGLGIGVWVLTHVGQETARVEVGARAPDIDVVNLATGDTVDLRDQYKGKVTLLNIWATWCVPCRQEMPSMQKAYARLKDEGFAIAAVSIDEGGPEDVLAFTREFGLTFDILHDRSGRISTLYQTTGVPESFLLDKDGVIIKRVIGAHDWSSPANIALIERLLGKVPPAPADSVVVSPEERI
ncbi:MAG TPA: TlpA disulfide reductase family protein [Gemmatimonadales bacterium]|nr:TlpA disulfide reductase family protein [Gemmatimonadales bacterium]